MDIDQIAFLEISTYIGSVIHACHWHGRIHFQEKQTDVDYILSQANAKKMNQESAKRRKGTPYYSCPVDFVYQKGQLVNGFLSLDSLYKEALKRWYKIFLPLGSKMLLVGNGDSEIGRVLAIHPQTKENLVIHNQLLEIYTTFLINTETLRRVPRDKYLEFWNLILTIEG